MMYDRVDFFSLQLGPLHMLIVGLILIIPFWKLLTKAGFSGAWSLLILVPLVNLILLYVLAFSDWPALARKA